MFTAGPVVLAVTVALGLPAAQSHAGALGALLSVGVVVGFLLSQAAMIAGAFWACSSIEERCSRCDRRLRSRHLSFPSGLHERLLTVARGAGPMAFLELAESAKPPAGAKELASLHVELCECTNTGRLTISKLRWCEELGRFDPVEESGPVHRTGWLLSQLATLAERRAEERPGGAP